MINTTIHRQIALDTETTGINKIGLHYEGHNIIEIAAIEIINRKLTGVNFHVYINPNRTIDDEAFKIHGINNNFLKNKPTFATIANSFLKFIENTELIIHNASFDIGFIDYELSKLHYNFASITQKCKIIDTLILARKLFPGKRNNLNALCERLHINNSQRTLHNALLDAQLLAKVYLAMTGGQIFFDFSSHLTFHKNKTKNFKKLTRSMSLKILKANDDEIIQHKKILNIIEQKIGKKTLWNLIK
uniref:DNA polymerase III subunit epsilon n=1 Tax=Candidatus Aschnera chinzeii TaxID=1485666 RepID=A0AAT9G4U4_9ENTR|nr:MAG: DNA polymerase III subunit epsilon [Candidatus Aschnera chinzeii]